MVALEAGCSPAEVVLAVLGVPPKGLVVPWSEAAIGGFALERVLTPVQLARLESRIARLWPPGPYALGLAAAVAAEAVITASRRRLNVLTVLDGEFGVRNRVGALPALLDARGVAQVHAPSLTAARARPPRHGARVALARPATRLPSLPVPPATCPPALPASIRGMRSLAAAAVLALAGAAAAAPGDIAPASLLDHIKFLSSDELQGRGHGSPELERAADYVAQQFRAAGLQPGGDDGSWFQPFELVAGLTVGERNELSFSFGSRTARFALGSSYYPLAAPASDSTDTPSTALENVPLVFAGYGLVVPSIGYDDYRRVDVSGKAVVIFSHEPQERLSSSAMSGARPVMESTLAAKEGAARSRGASALIVIGDPSHLVDQADYTLFSKDPDAEDRPIPVLRVRRREVQPLVDQYQLDALARQIDADLAPRSMALNGATMTYIEHLTKNRRAVRNVVGVLPGERSSPGEGSRRHRRALRPRGQGRQPVDVARADGRGAQRRRRQRVGHVGRHRNRAGRLPPSASASRAPSCSSRSRERSAGCWGRRTTWNARRCRWPTPSPCSTSTWWGGPAAAWT